MRGDTVGLELAPIGGQLFAHGDSKRDCKAFWLPIGTYTTCQLVRPLKEGVRAEVARPRPSHTEVATP
jgi:hypothetical protein